MIQKTTAIILHTTKYSESSLIIKAYTRHFGLQSYIINNIRNKKSKNKAVLFQPLAIVDIVSSTVNKSNLQRISEMAAAHPYNTIPYDIIKSSIAIFINEILYRALKEEHADEELFEYIHNSLLVLDLKMDSCSNFHVYFMIQLSRYLGFFPQGKYSSNNSIFDLREGLFVNQTPLHPNYVIAPDSQLLYDFIVIGSEKCQELKLSKAQRKELLTTLITYYQLHISSLGEIKSHIILEEVAA